MTGSRGRLGDTAQAIRQQASLTMTTQHDQVKAVFCRVPANRLSNMPAPRHMQADTGS